MMQDISNELRERANLLRGKINAELAQYEFRVEQLRAKRDRKIAELRAGQNALHRLAEIAAWQQSARKTFSAMTAAAEAMTEALVQTPTRPQN